MPGCHSHSCGLPAGSLIEPWLLGPSCPLAPPSGYPRVEGSVPSGRAMAQGPGAGGIQLLLSNDLWVLRGETKQKGHGHDKLSRIAAASLSNNWISLLPIRGLWN